MRNRVFPSLLLLVPVLSACLPSDLRMPQSPALSFLERKSGLIAFIGVDGNIYVSDQGGGNLKDLTRDAQIPENDEDKFHIYQHPTWSSDGLYLAFTSLEGEGNEAVAEILIADLEADVVSSAYTSNTELPYYLYWSPDNKNVSFLSTAASGQTQILQRVARNSEREILDTGTPLYWTWAPDGQTMFIHASDPSSGGLSERAAFLSMEAGITEVGLDVELAPFQAPAWSPDGSKILYAIQSGEKEGEIIAAEADGNNPRKLGTYTGKVAFGWSSDSSRLAYIESEEVTGTGTLGKLHVLDLETMDELIQDEQVIAFFWSPDGSELAYFVPFLEESADGEDSQLQDLILELNILDVGSGENREMLTYKPTGRFAEILPYFDQYQQSSTIWSPDSNNLVLSFIDNDGSPGIAIVAASGRLEPRLLAQGVLAFWSWK